MSTLFCGIANTINEVDEPFSAACQYKSSHSLDSWLEESRNTL
jgi:hypothetical protein